ncbi:MAG: cache domain-containing protein [Chloroflexi bacterium]|nr:cache domain-containing protein [Chloroflexota bacterium]
MRRFSIRNKLFVSFSLLVLIALSAGFYTFYSTAKTSLTTTIHSELNNSTALIANLVQAVAATSIENHLKSIAETQLAMVSGVHEEYLNGRYTETEAKSLAARLLLRQDIGTSGYLYCFDSQGNVPVHRDKQVQGSNLLAHHFVREQVRLKTGYLEYRWKNPGEAEERDKALYMTHFKPWDWIISATAYKSEFTYLIDIDNISKALAAVTFGDTGYPYIISTTGDYIYHPRLTGNLYNSGLDQNFINTFEEIIHLKQGTIYYQWQNPGEDALREKISIINYLGDYGWVVGSSAYLDDLYRPLTRIQQTFLLIFFVYLLLVLFAGYWLSTLITNPLKSLIAHFKDQAPIDVQLITGSFSDDEVGKLAGYLNQFIDKLNEHHQALATEISERKRSEKALRESEQTFHTLFDHSFQFIALLDPDCRVCKINKTALNFHNLTETEVLGKIFWNTPWWSHSETLVTQLKDAYAIARTGEVARFEAHSTAVQEIYLDISLKPVLDDTDQVIYIVAEARDVTDVRRAELELQQAQKMESVGTLAGGIAHDFNNILAGILGTISLLQLKRDKGQTIPEETLFKHLGTVSNAALRAKDIVNQLLTLSRKHDLQLASVDLRQIMEHVCQIAGNSFDKSVRIEVQTDSSSPVHADANSLEQVFLNICINAAHAMTIMRPKGEPWGGTLSITVDKTFVESKTGNGAGDFWRVSIDDTGVGMDDATLERIFVPFFTTKPKGTSSGLGLAMVYNIVKQHQGFIDVQSKKGVGSTFHIYLPVGQKETRDSLSDDFKETLEPGEGLILVIDDEELIRNTASEILTACGYQVLTAQNGEEGVALYQKHHQEVRAVLLDMVMPVMAGKETFHALKTINPKVKVLLSSGFRHDSRVDEILQAGAVGFIQKPYPLYSLSSAIKNSTAAKSELSSTG